MKIRYTGGRTHLEISLNRKSYYFTKESNRIADIKDPAIINYIFSLPNRGEFEVVMEEPEAVKPNVMPDTAEVKPELKQEEVKEFKNIKKIGRPKKGGR